MSVQVLTVAQMRAAEQALFDRGTSVSALMEIAAGGAAEWVRRVAAGRDVTVLCGPGNNGGDGYVIARLLQEAGLVVTVAAPLDPVTDAARAARSRWGGPVAAYGARGGVLVDCLFGSGLARPLRPDHARLLSDLAATHTTRIAVDLPSGIAADSGAALNEGLPRYDLTLALGAWKFAHWSLPARTLMGQLRLVPIGIGQVAGAAHLIARPRIEGPAVDAHKYSRGLLGIVGGAMPGAARLAAAAAQHAGAGYVKLLARTDPSALPPDLVVDPAPLPETLRDARIAAVLVGPGLGRDDRAKATLAEALASSRALVIDADALMLLGPSTRLPDVPMLATPHDGELAQLCTAFGIAGDTRRERATALARRTGITVLAKGPDTLVAAPDGRLGIAPPAPRWLSVAGTGDVLAGIAASRMAAGDEPFRAACTAVWLHGEAARRAGPAFSPSELAAQVSGTLAACL